MNYVSCLIMINSKKKMIKNHQRLEELKKITKLFQMILMIMRMIKIINLS